MTLKISGKKLLVGGQEGRLSNHFYVRLLPQRRLNLLLDFVDSNICPNMCHFNLQLDIEGQWVTINSVFATAIQCLISGLKLVKGKFNFWLNPSFLLNPTSF